MTKPLTSANLGILLEKVVVHLKKERLRFALAGGVAVSLYRSDIRTTNDLDFLLLAEGNSQTRAEEVIRLFGLEPSLARKADLAGGPLFAIKRKSTEPYMVIGRKPGHPEIAGLDFILPAMPWFKTALDRAEYNLVDFGHGDTPTLTVEDVLLSKFFSIQNDTTRFKDLDDLQSILKADHPLDLAYLSGQMERFQLVIPLELKEVAPKPLAKISKSIHRQKKRLG